MEITENHISRFLLKCKNANWAGVFFSTPFQDEFQFFLQDLNNIHLHSQEQFIFHPFDSAITPRVILNPQYKNEKAIKELDQNIQSSGSWELPVLKNMESTDKKLYIDQFKKYIAAIHNGECTKAILSTVTKLPKPAGLNIGELIFKLRKEYPQAFIYLFSSPVTGTWIGATPETFLKWKEGKVTTMSLAGTRNKSEAGFIFNEKEISEQEIVTRYIQDIFKKYFSKIKIGEPVEFYYGEMVHLITHITAQIPPGFNHDNLMRLAHEFHPTPAVGGYPKNEAISLIRATEKYSRLYYSGYLGPIGERSAELAVNLRCLTINNDSVYVFAGGGITKESEVEAEWAETRLKAQALLKFI